MKKLLTAIFSKRLHISKIDQSLQRLLSEKRQDKTNLVANRVAVIQKQISPVKHVSQFVESIYTFIVRATEQGATYVIFPEYIFFDFFGVIPFFQPINHYLNKRSFAKITNNENPGNKDRGNSLLFHLFDIFAIPSEKAILHIMKQFAKCFSIYIYTGSYIHKESNKLYNVGSLIDPKGNIILTQRKVHLTDFEDSIGLSRGNNFKVIHIPIGKTAIPICMDATYFETFKLVRKLGANIVIIPIANNEPYNEWKAMRGIWPRVQEAYVYGLKAALTGSIAGLEFTGKAGIFAPIDMTDNKDGVIAITESYVGNDIVIADLHLKQLVEIRENAPYQNDVNPIFEQNYYTKTYGKADRKNVQD